MHVKLDESDLRSVIETVVAETLKRVQADRAKLNGRLAYREPEAAALLGVAPHVLRDARRRGKIQGTRIGRYIIYSRESLLEFLAARPGR